MRALCTIGQETPAGRERGANSTAMAAAVEPGQVRGGILVVMADALPALPALPTLTTRQADTA
jgi:hypothetical protein